MWGPNVALCASITAQRDPKELLCTLWQIPEGSQSNPTCMQAPETWPRLMWESSYGTVHNNSSSRNETQWTLIWTGCNPSAQSLARKWNMPFLRTNTVSPIAKQLLCMPCPWNESRIGYWCQSSPAALKQQPGPEAGHMPSPVWHCPGHRRSACKHSDFSCMSRKQTSLQRPMRMQRKSAQQKRPK